MSATTAEGHALSMTPQAALGLTAHYPTTHPTVELKRFS